MHEMEVVPAYKYFLNIGVYSIPRLSTSIKPKFKLNTIAYRLVKPFMIGGKFQDILK